MAGGILSLSAAEVAERHREAMAESRRQRIIQAREQAKAQSQKQLACYRQQVEQIKASKAHAAEQRWMSQKSTRMDELAATMDSCTLGIGAGHRTASGILSSALDRARQDMEDMAERNRAAVSRHRAAIASEAEERAAKLASFQDMMLRRRAANVMEVQRSAAAVRQRAEDEARRAAEPSDAAAGGGAYRVPKAVDYTQSRLHDARAPLLVEKHAAAGSDGRGTLMPEAIREEDARRFKIKDRQVSSMMALQPREEKRTAAALLRVRMASSQKKIQEELDDQAARQRAPILQTQAARMPESASEFFERNFASDLLHAAGGDAGAGDSLREERPAAHACIGPDPHTLDVPDSVLPADSHQDHRAGDELPSSDGSAGHNTGNAAATVPGASLQESFHSWHEDARLHSLADSIASSQGRPAHVPAQEAPQTAPGPSTAASEAGAGEPAPEKRQLSAGKKQVRSPRADRPWRDASAAKRSPVVPKRNVKPAGAKSGAARGRAASSGPSRSARPSPQTAPAAARQIRPAVLGHVRPRAQPEGRPGARPGANVSSSAARARGPAATRHKASRPAKPKSAAAPPENTDVLETSERLHGWTSSTGFSHEAGDLDLESLGRQPEAGLSGSASQDAPPESARSSAVHDLAAILQEHRLGVQQMASRALSAVAAAQAPASDGSRSGGGEPLAASSDGSAAPSAQQQHTQEPTPGTQPGSSMASQAHTPALSSLADFSEAAAAQDRLTQDIIHTTQEVRRLKQVIRDQMTDVNDWSVSDVSPGSSRLRPSPGDPVLEPLDLASSFGLPDSLAASDEWLVRAQPLGGAPSDVLAALASAPVELVARDLDGAGSYAAALPGRMPTEGVGEATLRAASSPPSSEPAEEAVGAPAPTAAAAGGEDAYGDVGSEVSSAISGITSLLQSVAGSDDGSHTAESLLRSVGMQPAAAPAGELHDRRALAEILRGAVGEAAAVRPADDLAEATLRPRQPPVLSGLSEEEGAFVVGEAAARISREQTGASAWQVDFGASVSSWTDTTVHTYSERTSTAADFGGGMPPPE